MKFRFIHDDGHGWVEVPMALIEILDLKGKISNYSYRKGTMAYLEEDCDASALVQALKQENITYEFEDVIHHGSSPVRSYSRFVA